MSPSLKAPAAIPNVGDTLLPRPWTAAAPEEPPPPPTASPALEEARGPVATDADNKDDALRAWSSSARAAE